MKKKVKITLEEWDYICADGCCSEYGMITTVNGIEVASHDTDTAVILEKVLKHLGIDVEVENIYGEY